LFSAGCRSRPPPKPSAEFARDAALETQVRAFLEAEKTLQNEPIDVVVNDGTIILRGKASGERQKEKAAEVAIRAGHGAPVKNEIIVEG
jgi:osmotically-inducible protein OsmY